MFWKLLQNCSLERQQKDKQWNCGQALEKTTTATAAAAATTTTHQHQTKQKEKKQNQENNKKPSVLDE